MEKSFNDIKAQAERCIALAAELGKYCNNAKHRVDTAYIQQVAARTRSQHGISMFTTNRDEKKPFIYQPCSNTQPPLKDLEPAPKPVVAKTPTEAAHDRMKLNDWLDADEANRKTLQEICRHNFVKKMFAELLADMTICKMEGWDVMEFPRMLRQELTKCFPQPVQLSLF